jgi:hypothetical protein
MEHKYKSMCKDCNSCVGGVEIGLRPCLVIPVPLQFSSEILRPPGGSVSQTTVLRYKEIGCLLCKKHRRNGFDSI